MQREHDDKRSSECHVSNTGPALPDVIVTSALLCSGVFTSTVKNPGYRSDPCGIAIGVAYSVDGVYRTWGSVSGPLAAGASVTIGNQGWVIHHSRGPTRLRLSSMT